MKPPPFAYDRPASLAEATALLDRHGEDAKLLAGGQSLIPLLNFRLARPERLIDLGRLHELAYLREDAGVLHIGALTRMSQLHGSGLVARSAPLLVEAASHVAHPQIRNRGTVGGSVAHADPSAELPAALLALDAGIVVRSSAAERVIAAVDFFQGVYTTALEPNEILTEIVIPLGGGAGAFEEFARRSGDFALGAVAVQLGVGDDRRAVRIAAIGLAGTAVRLTAAERVIAEAAAEPAAAAVGEAVRAELEEDHARVDPFARRVVVELSTRAYARARERLRAGEAHGA